MNGCPGGVSIVTNKEPCSREGADGGGGIRHSFPHRRGKLHLIRFKLQEQMRCVDDRRVVVLEQSIEHADEGCQCLYGAFNVQLRRVRDDNKMGGKSGDVISEIGVDVLRCCE